MSMVNTSIFVEMGKMSKDGYFIFHPIGKDFQYLNDAFSSIWEIPISEVKAEPSILWMQIHPEDKEHVKDCYFECLTDNQAKKYEFRLSINGLEKYVRVSIFPIDNGGELLLCGMMEDTTVMRHNKIHIEQINARKNITLEVLAHDLQEPFGMMQMTASHMANELKGGKYEGMMDAVDFIHDLCDRNLRLVRSMINREFLKSAEVEIGKERADLVNELRDMLRFYRRSQLSDTKTFHFSTSHEKIFIHLDTMKFLQVINNLISNALKFTPEPNGFIGLHTEELDNSVIISVRDNGIGIPKHLQPGLFDRLPQTLRQGIKGEPTGGFGMGIIKAIVELHKGRVWFESEEGKGSTFYIELPK